MGVFAYIAVSYHTFLHAGQICRMDNKKQPIQWYKSLPIITFKEADIDAENGIIRNVVMVEEGEAKGHGVNLEDEFISALVAYDNATFGTRGVPGRFGHPGASDNTMGAQMGFFKNVRKRKVGAKMQAVADLHLLEASDDSPTHPGMRTYIMKMAAEAPDFMMSSIVFRFSALYQRKKNGHKTYINSEWDADPDLGEVFVEFGDKGRHYFTDLVDQGAATDNLFSAKANPKLFISQAEIFLAEHPELKQFIQQNPISVQNFLHSIGASPAPAKPHISMSKITDFLFGKGDAPDGVDAAELTQLKADLAEVKSNITQLQTELSTANATITQLQSDLTAATAKNTQLQTELTTAKARVTELEAIPGAEPTKGPTAPAAELGKKAYEVSPVTAKARARFNAVTAE